MSHCLLTTIHNRMFTGLGSLEYLYLSHNLVNSFQIKRKYHVVEEIKSANMTPWELELVREHLFHGLNSLRALKLQGNRFTKLDLRVFCNLTKLIILNLSSNEIDELGGILEKFVTLDPSKNQLSYVPETLCPNLFLLNLEENPIRTLDAQFLTPLEDRQNRRFYSELTDSIFDSSVRPAIVDLYRIKMATRDRIYCEFLFSNSQPLKAIESILRKHDEMIVEKFSLNNCLLKTLDALELSTRFPNLTTLNPRWNSLNCFEACWIEGINNLQALYLQGNQIETLDDANLLASCLNLKELDLSEYLLKSINRRLLHGLYKLESLNLSDNPELTCFDDGLFRSLFSVTNIDLSGNNIKQLDLLRLFKSCRRLAELNLSNNRLDNRTLSRKCMIHLSNLETLLLNDNQLENIEFVRDMIELRRLGLKNNRIESIEKDDYNFLGRLRSLQRLDLSDNCIQLLSKELLIHLESELVELDVSGNLFQSEPQLGL